MGVRGGDGGTIKWGCEREWERANLIQSKEMGVMLAWSRNHFESRALILVDTGLIGEFFPELPAMRLEQDPTHRHEDVLAHTIAVFNNVAACATATQLHHGELVDQLAGLLVAVLHRRALHEVRATGRAAGRRCRGPGRAWQQRTASMITPAELGESHTSSLSSTLSGTSPKLRPSRRM